MSAISVPAPAREQFIGDASAPTILLDIDGVLVAPEWTGVANAEAVLALNWLLAVSGAQIVVSSTWRILDDYDLARLRKTLDGLGVADAPIVGCTGHTLSGDGYFNGRELEVRNFARTHALKCWVSLDDSTRRGGQMVRTNPNKGLTMKDAAHAAEILKELAA